MNKVVLAGLALILVRDCDIGGPRFHGQIKGTWGGDNAGLMAFDTTAHVPLICPWKRGPPISQSRTRIRARPASTTLFMRVPPYRLPLHPAPRHKQLAHEVRRAPPSRLGREIDHQPVREYRGGHRPQIV